MATGGLLWDGSQVLAALTVFVFLSAFSCVYEAEAQIKLKFANFIAPTLQEFHIRPGLGRG
jgi:hypothetical protein